MRASVARSLDRFFCTRSRNDGTRGKRIFSPFGSGNTLNTRGFRCDSCRYVHADFSYLVQFCTPETVFEKRGRGKKKRNDAEEKFEKDRDHPRARKKRAEEIYLPLFTHTDLPSISPSPLRQTGNNRSHHLAEHRQTTPGTITLPDKRTRELPLSLEFRNSVKRSVDR